VSSPPPAPDRDSIDRREALRRVALVLGGAISAPALAGLLAGCEKTVRAPGSAWIPRALSPDQGEMVAVIADRIIPRTDTPGARDVGVHEFIDAMLADYYDAGDRARFIEGLGTLYERALEMCGAEFVRCAPERQIELLTRFDDDTFGSSRPRPQPDPRRDTEHGPGTPLPSELRAETARPRPTHPATPFFRMMKELTLLGYYTSEAGATRELRYVPVPGRFDGCVPFTTIGRTWAV
jgi:glucoside 3-dehydrogenase (cytochrome c) hitch-hiker subunit